MTHFERIHKAMRLEKPDRVPVMCQLSLEFIERNNGKPVDWRNAESAANAFLNMRKMFEFDGVLVTGMISDSNSEPITQINHRGKEISEIEPDAVSIKLDYSRDMALHKLIVAKSRKDSFSVHGEIASPFDAFCFLTNLENVFSGLLLCPEKCHVILKKYVWQGFACARAQIDAGADAIKISSPLAVRSKGYYMTYRYYYMIRAVETARIS